VHPNLEWFNPSSSLKTKILKKKTLKNKKKNPIKKSYLILGGKNLIESENSDYIRTNGRITHSIDFFLLDREERYQKP